MKIPAALAAFAALSALVVSTAVPAVAARSSYVVDDAHLLSSTATAQLNQQIGDFNTQTGKEVVVVTTPSLDGSTPEAAIERSFAQQQVNGVEIFVAQSEHQIRIAGDTASRRFFPSGSFNTIAQSMRASFRANDYDGGISNAVGIIINTYRGHLSSLNTQRQPAGVSSGSVQRGQSGGFSMGGFWWIIILVVIFFVIRGIFRAMSGPRMMGGPGPMGGGPGYGGGYGPGYGGGYGGGGGFWSGLLGGLGGAFLGNELFGNRGGGMNVGGDGGSWANTGGTPGSADAGGWQGDAGQIDNSNIGGASWGDSGGGGGDIGGGGGWGGGDSGGGGGGDSGGGW